VIIGAFVEATLHILTTGDAGATVAVIDQLLSSYAARPGAMALRL